VNPATPLPANQLTFTVEESAALLGISPSTAYESVHRGELPALRFGRRLVVTRHTLETMLGLTQAPSTNDRSNRTRQPRRTRWVRLADTRVEHGHPDWATPHRRTSAD
jgi:excisionase family DNA binding protein